MDFNISNTFVYGLEHSIKASGNPMRTVIDSSEVSDKDLLRATKLGSSQGGQGHDNFLKGIIVQMDVVAPLFWWKEAQRYHWFDFISSQSTMHCLLKFDISLQCVSDTDPRIIEIIKELIGEYNKIPAENTIELKAQWRRIVASLPSGFCLGASMTTNYQQLKTMYFQRKGHKLIEWGKFCDWAITLPQFKELIGINDKGEKI